MMTNQVDFINSVCPCAGLSMLNTSTAAGCSKSHINHTLTNVNFNFSKSHINLVRFPNPHASAVGET